MTHINKFPTYRKDLKAKAQFLRKNMTKGEVLLWLQLKGKIFYNLDFHRQKPIGNYIVDFYCPKLKLVIEIDGASHDEKKYEYDNKREEYLNHIGLRVLRFTEQDVVKRMENVLDTLENLVKEHTPSS